MVSALTPVQAKQQCPMALRSKLERDALFKKMRAKAENKVRVCAGCLPWPYGILYLVLVVGKALTQHSIGTPLNVSVRCFFPEICSFG